MKKVTGIGGIFFEARDPEALRAWYRQHLGIECNEDGAADFEWPDPDRRNHTGRTIWSLFPHDTRYFDLSKQPFMVNYRVANLDALLDELREAGVEVDVRVEQYEYGRFAWVMDPEGNRIELWEPAGERPELKIRRITSPCKLSSLYHQC